MYGAEDGQDSLYRQGRKACQDRRIACRFL